MVRCATVSFLDTVILMGLRTEMTLKLKMFDETPVDSPGWNMEQRAVICGKTISSLPFVLSSYVFILLSFQMTLKRL